MNDTVVLVLAIVLAAAALVGGAVWLASILDKKRTEGVQRMARRMGLDFSLRSTADELAQVAGDLPIFGCGHRKRAARVMRGELEGQPIAILDYRYSTGGGKNSHTHRQTIVVLPDGARSLPDFTLAQENVLHRIAGVFGLQDIDFPAQEEFSKRYLLRGPDEKAIRAAFPSPVLSFLGRLTGWQLQSGGGRLALFREGRYTKPEEIPGYAAEALRIARAFETKAI